MAKKFRIDELEMRPREAKIDAYRWLTSPRLHQLAGSKNISKFDVRSLSPGTFSFPYHFHRTAEELFVVLEGAATLRTPQGFEPVEARDILFFPAGREGAHQLYNDGDVPCLYVDVSVVDGPDVIEYPDSGKIGVVDAFFRRTSQVDYYEGEEDPASRWPDAREINGEGA